MPFRWLCRFPPERFKDSVPNATVKWNWYVPKIQKFIGPLLNTWDLMLAMAESWVFGMCCWKSLMEVMRKGMRLSRTSCSASWAKERKQRMTPMIVVRCRTESTFWSCLWFCKRGMFQSLMALSFFTSHDASITMTRSMHRNKYTFYQAYDLHNRNVPTCLLSPIKFKWIEFKQGRSP